MLDTVCKQTLLLLPQSSSLIQMETFTLNCHSLNISVACRVSLVSYRSCGSRSNSLGAPRECSSTIAVKVYNTVPESTVASFVVYFVSQNVPHFNVSSGSTDVDVITAGVLAVFLLAYDACIVNGS